MELVCCQPHYEVDWLGHQWWDLIRSGHGLLRLPGGDAPGPLPQTVLLPMSEARVTNSSWFAQDFLDFKTESLSWEDLQSQEN